MASRVRSHGLYVEKFKGWRCFLQVRRQCCRYFDSKGVGTCTLSVLFHVLRVRDSKVVHEVFPVGIYCHSVNLHLSESKFYIFYSKFLVISSCWNGWFFLTHRSQPQFIFYALWGRFWKSGGVFLRGEMGGLFWGGKHPHKSTSSFYFLILLVEMGVSCGFIFDGSFKFKINFQTWTRTELHRKRWISWVHTRSQQLESG